MPRPAGRRRRSSPATPAGPASPARTPYNGKVDGYRTLLPEPDALCSAWAAPLLVLLTGCPDDARSYAAPGRMSAAATAPAVPAASAAAAAATSPAPVQAPQTAQVLAANQQAQRAQELVDRANAAYRSGVANYNANRLDAARLDFDFAVDTMLSSGMDLRKDPLLADEFDRLLSAINSLELVALKQGNGFSPRLEAAPAEDAETVTFAADPALLGRLNAEIKTTQSDLPLVVNEYVAGWINAYTNNPARHAHLKRSLERAGKYKDLISRILRENGVPQDLIYQAITESGFQPQVVNRSSGAGGMWQFMPFVGSYGLARNGYFDERFDPEKSTIAYAKYMKMLYGLFGDWYLAMAAYDWGPGRVQHIVSRTGYADYWDIYRHGGLPAETKAYIPSVIAAVIMARNPEQYGLTDLRPDPPILSDTVTTTYAIDLRLVADVTESSVAEIVALNPALLRLSTPRDSAYDLHIPSGMHEVFAQRLKDIPEDKRSSWRFHIVKPGETLESIATSMRAKATEIAIINEVTATEPLEVEDELVVPVAAPSSSFAGQQRYKLRGGDTLVTVADRFGVTVEQLRAWNGSATRRLSPGHTLLVAEPVRLAPGTHTSRGRRGKAGRRAAVASTRGRRGSAASVRGSATPSRTSHASASRRPAAKASAPKPKAKRRR